jgi:hypothetical protein
MSEKLTQGQRIVQLLESHPDGLPTGEILTMLNLSKSALYTSVHAENHKGRPYRILNINQRYKLIPKKGSANSTLPAVIDPSPKQLLPAGFTLSNETLRKMKALPETDREDMFDMLKKSHFYKRSAEVLLEANEAVGILRTSLTL